MSPHAQPRVWCALVGQQQQAQSALVDGAEVIVLDPVDSQSAAVIVQQAESQGVPVISYDRLITDAPKPRAGYRFNPRVVQTP